MAFRQKKIPHIFAFQGFAVANVVNTGHMELAFDDPASSLLNINGEVILISDDHTEVYVSPFPEWVEVVFSTFIGVVIVAARFDSTSAIRIVFADGRELHIPDGTFEHWHYINDDRRRAGQGWLHGGIGRVV